jgi:hypothetical protein
LGGAYCAYDGEQPYGWSQNFATGGKTPWIATGHVLSDEQIAAIHQEREQNHQELEANLARIQDEIAVEAFELLSGMDEASPNFTALEAGICSSLPVRGLRPFLAARSTTLKLPKPEMATASPFFKAPAIRAKRPS